jgi:3-oxoacyl-[acyl-carrier-protein] synthase-3
LKEGFFFNSGIKIMNFYRSKVLATGAYHPKKVLTNDDLSKMVETNHQWIMERTGIAERRVCSTEGGEFPSDMAEMATRDALKKAGADVDIIDCILFCTSTPDYPLPNTACILQTKLGIKNNCACLDVQAACSGFVYGFNMANSMIQTGMFKNILVVGTDMISSRVDYTDRTTCILFGDGCGVAVVSRNEDENNPSQVYSSVLSADGTGKDFFFAPGGTAVNPPSHEMIDKKMHYMKMQGQEMFKVAVRTLADNAQKVLSDADMSIDEVDWMVPHQANLRIIEATANRLKFPMEKVIVNIDRFGNTSAATVPMALHEAIEDGRIKRGDVVLLDAFGAGLTAGATLLKF